MSDASPSVRASAKLAWSVAAVLAVTVVALTVSAWWAPGSSQPAEQSATIVKIVDAAGGNETLGEIAVKGGQDPTPLPNPAVHQSQQDLARSETIKVTLQPEQKTEIKARLAAGKMIIYSWKVQKGPGQNAAGQGLVYSDFHGHDPDKAKDFWVRYEEHQEAASAQGSLVAPFDGEHGWFWMNVSEEPVEVTLVVQGFHKEIVNHGLL